MEKMDAVEVEKIEVERAEVEVEPKKRFSPVRFVKENPIACAVGGGVIALLALATGGAVFLGSGGAEEPYSEGSPDEG